MSTPRGSVPVSMHQVPGADLVIASVQANGPSEVITVANRGELDQPLSGWALASLHGIEVFQFPDGTVLPSRGQLRIVSGEGSLPAGGPRDLLWMRQNVWNNRSDTVFLFDNQGREVSRFMYPRPTIREERRPKLKILARELDGYHLRDWDDVVPPGKD